MTLNEINEATTLIQKEAHEDANIIWGMVIDEAAKEDVRVTVIATGFGARAEEKEKVTSRFRKVAPIPTNTRESGREIPSFSFSMKEHNREVPLRMKRVRATERFDEVKLDDPPDFSLEEDRFDIPTFLRKQPD